MSKTQTAPWVPRFRCGFTILELILSVAIIALLAGLLLPSLSLVKRSGQKTRELSAARQLMVGGRPADSYLERSVAASGHTLALVRGGEFIRRR